MHQYLPGGQQGHEQRGTVLPPIGLYRRHQMGVKVTAKALAAVG